MGKCCQSDGVTVSRRQLSVIADAAKVSSGRTGSPRSNVSFTPAPWMRKCRCSGTTWERHLVQTWQEIIGLLGGWGYFEGWVCEQHILRSRGVGSMIRPEKLKILISETKKTYFSVL